MTRATKFVTENDAATVAGYLAPYFDGTPEESIANSVQAYKDIDAWVQNMAMKESAFERLQDVIENSGELERRVGFDELILTETANRVYQEVYR